MPVLVSTGISPSGCPRGVLGAPNALGLVGRADDGREYTDVRYPPYLDGEGDSGAALRGRAEPEVPHRGHSGVKAG